MCGWVESMRVMPVVAVIGATIVGSVACMPPVDDGDEVSAAAAPIVGGADDVIFDASGRVDDSLAQWARDASVAIMLGGNFKCSGPWSRRGLF